MSLIIASSGRNSWRQYGFDVPCVFFRTDKKCFSNFSCSFLNPNYFFPIWKHSVSNILRILTLQPWISNVFLDHYNSRSEQFWKQNTIFSHRQKPHIFYGVCSARKHISSFWNLSQWVEKEIIYTYFHAMKCKFKYSSQKNCSSFFPLIILLQTSVCMH